MGWIGYVEEYTCIYIHISETPITEKKYMNLKEIESRCKKEGLEWRKGSRRIKEGLEGEKRREKSIIKLSSQN